MRGAVRWVVTAAVAAAVLLGQPESGTAQQKKEIPMGPYHETLKPNDSIDAAIARGRTLFNDLGCAGCHPRGGTIGGTARDFAGNPVPIPIPPLKDAALHFPRVAGPGILVNLGQMNDL